MYYLSSSVTALTSFVHEGKLISYQTVTASSLQNQITSILTLIVKCTESNHSPSKLENDDKEDQHMMCA